MSLKDIICSHLIESTKNASAIKSKDRRRSGTYSNFSNKA